MTNQEALKIVTNFVLCQRKLKDSCCKPTECKQCYFNYNGTASEQLEALFIVLEMARSVIE